MRIAFFGSSLVSAYWNGAATYYRGIVRSLHERGHEITFYEPDAWGRQQHRDMSDPEWAKVVVYAANQESALRAVGSARHADLIVKASGVGVFDDLLEAAVVDLKKPSNMVVFWDVDAPATLERVQANPADAFAALIPRFDIVFTYGGGNSVAAAYEALGAKQCIAVYNALDAHTHFPAPPDERFRCDLAFLGNCLPDREARVNEFFFKPAGQLPESTFLIGGSGWVHRDATANVRYLDHVYTADHNVFNSTPRLVLNVTRDSMARFGFSPATRVFEAAGAAACMITDAWEGVGTFFEPGTEMLVAANGEAVADYVRCISDSQAKRIGAAAYKRVLAQHTYAHRAAQVDQVLGVPA